MDALYILAIGADLAIILKGYSDVPTTPNV